MTQTKVDNKWVEEKIIEILGLETAPDGQKNYLLTRNEHGQILEGVSFNSEVKELMNLLTQTQQDTLGWFKTLPSMRMERDISTRGKAVYIEKENVIRNALRKQISKELRQIIKNKMEVKMTLKNNKQGGEK